MRLIVGFGAVSIVLVTGCAGPLGAHFEPPRDDQARKVQPAPRAAVLTSPVDATGPDAPRSPLLGEVGKRTDEAPPRYALRILEALGLHTPPALQAAATGPELLAAARGFIEADARALAGDLLFFDGGAVVAVATTTHGDTVEFVYVRGGVVRRGVVTRSRPHDKRDRDGRALNTFVRPWAKDDGAGQKYLAGEIFDGLLRLDRLVAGNRIAPALH